MVILTKSFINIFCIGMSGFMMSISYTKAPVDPFIFSIAVAYYFFPIVPGIILSNILLKNTIVFLTVSLFIYIPIAFPPPIRLEVLAYIFLSMAYSSLISILAYFIESKLLQEAIPQRRRKIVNPKFRN